MSTFSIPAVLAQGVAKHETGQAWLKTLPGVVADLARDWSLTLHAPFENEVTGSWVAPCESLYGPAVIKVGFPHFEADHEIEGLALWQGDSAVKLYASNPTRHALLLERCVPGASLRQAPPDVQDRVICDILLQLWQAPVPATIRSLRSMIDRWCTSAEARFAHLNSRFVTKGLDTLRDLAESDEENVLLATDLHAGNILSATRQPWLMIDPKPHVGDPCYDLTQHLLNIQPRIQSEGVALIEALARNVGVDARRVLHWTYGRLCLDTENHVLAKALGKLI